jgi:copper chaperone CopZ
VSDVKTDYQSNTATVTFDDEKTSVDEMIDALEEGGYPIKGKPKFLS